VCLCRTAGLSTNGKFPIQKFKNRKKWKTCKKVEPKYLKNYLSESCHTFPKIKADQDLENYPKKIYKNKKNKILLKFKCKICVFLG